MEFQRDGAPRTFQLEHGGQLAQVIGFESTADRENDITAGCALDFQHESSLLRTVQLLGQAQTAESKGADAPWHSRDFGNPEI